MRNNRLLAAIATALSLLVGGATVAMPRPADPPSMAEAQGLVQAGQFDKAAAAFEAIIEADPENGQAWFMLGYSLHAGGHIKEAIPVHQMASTHEDFEGIALYNLACAHSLLGEADEAFAAMALSIEAGFDVENRADDDPDFDNVRDDPRYAMLVHGGESVEVKRTRQPMSRGGGPGDMEQLFQFVGMRVQQIIEEMSPQIEQHMQIIIGQAMASAQELMGQFQHKMQQDEELMGAINQIHQAIESNPQLMMAIEQAHQWIESKMGGMNMGGMMGGGQAHAAPPAAEADHRQELEALAEQAADALPTFADAQALQQSGEYGAAAELFAFLVELNPDDPRARFGFAYNLHMSGDIDGAIKAHKAAAEFEQVRGISLYNLGCAYALKGNVEACIKALKASMENGWDVAGNVPGDSDFDGVRDNETFQKFMEEIGG